MYTPKYCLRSFEHLPPEEKKHVLGMLLEALATANQFYLIAYPRTPLLYQSGVRYLQEPDGEDDWQDVPETLLRRTGDCEDLASWRMAERRVRFGDRRSVFDITVDELPNHAGELVVTYHIRLATPEGIEDPSRVLGMP